MTDYISRDDLIHGLDAICEAVCEYPDRIDDAMCKTCHIDTVYHWLKDFPSADVKPVVYCRDCVWALEDYYSDGNVPNWSCANWDKGVDIENGYCYEGESKDD